MSLACRCDLWRRSPKMMVSSERFLPNEIDYLTGTKYKKSTLKRTLSGPSGIFLKPKDCFKTCFSHLNIRSHKQNLDLSMISSHGLRVKVVKSSHTNRRSFFKIKVSRTDWKYWLKLTILIFRRPHRPCHFRRPRSRLPWRHHAHCARKQIKSLLLGGSEIVHPNDAVIHKL